MINKTPVVCLKNCVFTAVLTAPKVLKQLPVFKMNPRRPLFMVIYALQITVLFQSASGPIPSGLLERCGNPVHGVVDPGLSGLRSRLISGKIRAENHTVLDDRVWDMARASWNSGTASRPPYARQERDATATEKRTAWWRSKPRPMARAKAP
jgi:hypothetical protein